MYKNQFAGRSHPAVFSLQETPLSCHPRSARVAGESGGLSGDGAVAPTGRAEHYAPSARGAENNNSLLQ